VRSPRRLLVAAGLGLALVACSGVVLHRGTAARPAVTELDIEGTHAVSAGDLESRLVTQASDGFFWHFFWRETRYFDPDAFENDKRRITRYYESKGYYSAKIVSAEAVPDGEGFVKVVVRVEEGKPTRVLELAIGGMEKAPEARAKLRNLPLREGAVFTEEAYDATRLAIQSALTSTGWARAEVAQQAQVDRELAQAKVRYTVKAGERYLFGNIRPVGSGEVVAPQRILEEVEDEIRPGDVFDATALPRAQARVYGLGIFGGVRVTEGQANEADRRIPVEVNATVAPPRTVRLGPGITIQNTRQEVDLMAGWSHRNWLGGLRRLALDAKAGYAWLPTILRATKQGFVGLLSADFTQPAILSRAVDLNVRAELERGLEPAYDFFAERLRFGVPMRLFGRTLSFTPSLNLEVYQISGQVSEADTATGQVLFLRTCPGQNPNLCLLSYFEQRIALDLRDDVIATRRGLYLGLSVQEGFSVFGNGSSYVRLLPEVRAFASLPWGFVLAGRARVGIVQPLRGSIDVPIVAKFTSGGPNLMRGYYTRDLSPQFFQRDPVQGCKNLVPDPENPGNQVCANGTYVPVGGNGLVDGSIELRFPISESLEGVTFLDYGNVRVSAAESLNLAYLQWALGTGIRYKTPFGPVRVDVALRLPTSNAGVQVVTILPSGAVESSGQVHHPPLVSLHLSVGQAF